MAEPTSSHTEGGECSSEVAELKEEVAQLKSTLKSGQDELQAAMVRSQDERAHLKSGQDEMKAMLARVLKAAGTQYM